VGTILEAPQFVVAVLELLDCAVFVGKVARCEHVARNAVDQLCGRFRTLKRIARRDVTRADQNERSGVLILFRTDSLSMRRLSRRSL